MLASGVHDVLIVDDDRLVRESLAEVTVDLGCEARLAASGDDALAALREQATGLLVSDVDMPDISGFELVDRVHALGLHPPFILMSARANPTLADEARRMGAVDFFAKPVALGSYSHAVRGVFSL